MSNLSKWRVHRLLLYELWGYARSVKSRAVGVHGAGARKPRQPPHSPAGGRQSPPPSSGQKTTNWRKVAEVEDGMRKWLGGYGRVRLKARASAVGRYAEKCRGTGNGARKPRCLRGGNARGGQAKIGRTDP